MKTVTVDKMMAHLRVIAPNVAFQVTWEHDPDARWEKDFTKQGLDEDDYEAWMHDVSAKAILEGVEVEGHAYLGGSWCKRGEKDPEIGGYLTQMLKDAMFDLESQINDANVDAQLIEVEGYLEAVLKDEYKAQQKGK